MHEDISSNVVAVLVTY